MEKLNDLLYELADVVYEQGLFDAGKFVAQEILDREACADICAGEELEEQKQAITENEQREKRQKQILEEIRALFQNR